MQTLSDEDLSSPRQSLEEDDGASFQYYHSNEERTLLSRSQKLAARSALPTENWRKWEPLIPRRLKKPKVKDSKQTNDKPKPHFLFFRNDETTTKKSESETQTPIEHSQMKSNGLPHRKCTPPYQTWRHFIISRQTNPLRKLSFIYRFKNHSFDFCPQLGEDHANVLKYNGDDIAMLNGERCRIHGAMDCFCVEFKLGFRCGVKREEEEEKKKEKGVFDFVRFARIEGVDMGRREEGGGDTEDGVGEGAD